jgi:secretion/DNA translocation related TadE-like protein
MSSWGRSVRDDSGVGSVLMLVVVLVLLVATTCGLALGGLALARQHVNAAADQAALAAASTGQCERAARLAELNNARLRECRWVGADVTVVLEASLPAVSRWLAGAAAGRPTVVLGSARAGPPVVPELRGEHPRDVFRSRARRP